MTEPAQRSLSASSALLYSVEDAARHLGIGRTFMFHLVATGEVSSVKIGKRRKVPRDALIEYVERLQSEQASTGDGDEDSEDKSTKVVTHTRLTSID